MEMVFIQSCVMTLKLVTLLTNKKNSKSIYHFPIQKYGNMKKDKISYCALQHNTFHPHNQTLNTQHTVIFKMIIEKLKFQTPKKMEIHVT